MHGTIQNDNYAHMTRDKAEALADRLNREEGAGGWSYVAEHGPAHSWVSVKDDAGEVVGRL